MINQRSGWISPKKVHIGIRTVIRKYLKKRFFVSEINQLGNATFCSTADPSSHPAVPSLRPPPASLDRPPFHPRPVSLSIFARRRAVYSTTLPAPLESTFPESSPASRFVRPRIPLRLPLFPPEAPFDPTLFRPLPFYSFCPTRLPAL